jgi:Phosphotransferase enzyme family
MDLQTPPQSYQMPTPRSNPFTGWGGASFHAEDSHQPNLRKACTKRINWDPLIDYASRLKSGMKCHVVPESTMGGCHLVHLLQFEDGTRWIVRFQLDPPTPASVRQLQSEVDTMGLIRSRTKIPVPQVFGSDPHNKTNIGVPFILMEYVPGIVAMDADGGWEVHHGEIAGSHKPKFYSTMASIQVSSQLQIANRPDLIFPLQVELTAVRMPKIGSVFKRNDGTYDIGPIPDLGGPFETATAYFRAWAARAKFPTSEANIRKSMGGGPVEEVLSSISKFPAHIKALAGGLSSHNKGPFPIYHPDLYHSNIIVDDKFNILGVIDWQGACTVPWELVEFPLFLNTVPRAMDAAFNYDQNGQPKHADVKLRWKERAEYVQMVKAAETTRKKDAALSKTLGNADVQGLAHAIKVYNDPGKLGFYEKILQPFQERQTK